MLHGVKGNTDADVLAIYVERRADSHWVDGVVLALEELWFAHDAVDGDVEAVVVLGSKAEDAEGALLEAFGILGVRIAEEAGDGEFAAFDPDSGGVFDAVEGDAAAVGGGDDDFWVIWGAARAGVRLELAVEELVEGFERLERVEDLAEVELMEVNEALDIAGRCGVIELLALLD